MLNFVFERKFQNVSTQEEESMSFQFEKVSNANIIDSKQSLAHFETANAQKFCFI